MLSHRHALAPRNDSSGPVAPPSSSELPPVPTDLDSLDFDVLRCPMPHLVSYCERIFDAQGLLGDAQPGTDATEPRPALASRAAFRAFVVAVTGHYHPVPYHSFFHAFSVMQITHVFLTRIPQFSPLQRFALLLSALLHGASVSVG